MRVKTVGEAANTAFCGNGLLAVLDHGQGEVEKNMPSQTGYIKQGRREMGSRLFILKKELVLPSKSGWI